MVKFQSEIIKNQIIGNTATINQITNKQLNQLWFESDEKVN